MTLSEIKQRVDNYFTSYSAKEIEDALISYGMEREKLRKEKTMSEEEAAKLAKKIKRCLSSVPKDVKVIIGSNQVSVIDMETYYQFETEPEKAPALAYECGGMRNILGYEEWT